MVTPSFLLLFQYGNNDGAKHSKRIFWRRFSLEGRVIFEYFGGNRSKLPRVSEELFMHLAPFPKLGQKPTNETFNQRPLVFLSEIEFHQFAKGC